MQLAGIWAFSKVSCFHSIASSLILGSLSLQSSGPMTRANPIPSMCSSSCLDTVQSMPPRCDKENSELRHNSAQHPLYECSVEVHFREIIDLVSSFMSYTRQPSFQYQRTVAVMHLLLSRTRRARSSRLPGPPGLNNEATQDATTATTTRRPEVCRRPRRGDARQAGIFRLYY